jgi:hypothetical protein
VCCEIFIILNGSVFKEPIACVEEFGKLVRFTVWALLELP